MTYTVERITNIDVKMERDMRRLMAILDDPEMSIDAWIDIFKRYTMRVSLVGAFDEWGNLHGFIYGRSPNPTYPNRGMMPITVMDPCVPRITSKQVFDAVLAWLEKHGAKYVWGWTKRSPRVLKRLYGYEVVAERQIIVPLAGHDEHTNVERMTANV